MVNKYAKSRPISQSPPSHGAGSIPNRVDAFSLAAVIWPLGRKFGFRAGIIANDDKLDRESGHYRLRDHRLRRGATFARTPGPHFPPGRPESGVGSDRRCRPEPPPQYRAAARSVDHGLVHGPQRSGNRGGRAAYRRPGTRPLDHAQSAPERKERHHGQQGRAGGARPRAIRLCPQRRPDDCLRGGRGRRDSRSSRPSTSRWWPTRSNRFTEFSTARATSSSRRWRIAARATPTPWPRRKSWALPRPIRPWTSTAATPRRSWRSWPTCRLAPGRLEAHPPDRHRHGRRGRHALCRASWAIASSSWPWPSWSPKDWNSTSRRPWCGSAPRWPRCKGPSTPCGSWATPWAASSCTASARARCRPPRPA